MNVIDTPVLVGQQFSFFIGTELEMQQAAQRAQGTVRSHQRRTKSVEAYRPALGDWDWYDLPLYQHLSIAWDDTFVEALHLGLLEESLETLRTCSDVEKNEDYKDIVAWIFNPLIPESCKVKESDGTIRTVYRPFCFTQCCKVTGLDPDELRSQLEKILEQQRIDFLRKKERKGKTAKT